MATLSIRMPDDKHNRLKALAQHRHISINKLIEELSTVAISEFDNKIKFRTLAASGNTADGLVLLDKLDAYFNEG